MHRLARDLKPDNLIGRCT